MLQCGHEGADGVFVSTVGSWRKSCRRRVDEALIQANDPKLSVAGWTPRAWPVGYPEESHLGAV